MYSPRTAGPKYSSRSGIAMKGSPDMILTPVPRRARTAFSTAPPPSDPSPEMYTP